jgi:hypothetical protein
MKLGLTEKQYIDLLTLISETDLKEQGDPPASEPEAGTSDKQSGGQGYPSVGKWESGVTRGPANQVGVTKWADVVGAKLTRGHANQLKEQSTVKSNQNNIKLFKGKEKPTPPIPAIEKYPNYSQIGNNGKTKYPYDAKNKFGEYLNWYYKSPINTSADIGYKDKLDIKYREDLNSWLISNMNMTLEDWERYYGRKSKSGKNVPKGFNPDSYDEYLNMSSTIQKQIDDLNSKHKMGYWNRKDLNQVNNLNKQLVDLKSEYSNSEFSYGITKDELNQYNQKKKEINDYYGNMLKNLGGDNNSSSKLGRFGQDNLYIPKKITTISETDKIKKEWSDELKKLDLLFGKDNWAKDVSILGQEFDRIWDKWGTALQIIGNIAIIAFSGGIAGVVSGGARAVGFTISSGAIRAAAPYVADSTFNALIGTYESSRGKNEEALISFLCAMVPYITYSKNIGKVSIDTAEGLARKIILGKFDTKESMDIFIKSLSPEERYIFRDTMSLPKEMIKRNFDLAVQTINKTLRSQGLKVPKSGISIWGPKVLKQLGVEGGIPVSGMIVNSLFKIIKNDYGHIYSSEELLDVKRFLNTLKTYNNVELLIKSADILSDLKNKNITKVNKPDLVKLIGTTVKYNEGLTQDMVNKLRAKGSLKNNIERIIDEK